MINFLCRKFGAKKFSLEDIYLSDTHRRKEKKLCQMPGSTAVPHRKLKPVSFFLQKVRLPILGIGLTLKQLIVTSYNKIQMTNDRSVYILPLVK